jgi:hypothetical protein
MNSEQLQLFMLNLMSFWTDVELKTLEKYEIHGNKCLMLYFKCVDCSDSCSCHNIVLQINNSLQIKENKFNIYNLNSSKKNAPVTFIIFE